MDISDKINLVVDVDYKKSNVKSKLSGDRNNYVSHVNTMSDTEKKVLKRMITAEFKQLTDPLNSIKLQKPKAGPTKRKESSKDELINVLQSENAQLREENKQLKKRIVKLEAENAQLKAEIVELKTQIVELKAANAELMATNAELMAMNKALLAKLELQGK